MWVGHPTLLLSPGGSPRSPEGGPRRPTTTPRRRQRVSRHVAEEGGHGLGEGGRDILRDGRPEGDVDVVLGGPLTDGPVPPNLEGSRRPVETSNHPSRFCLTSKCHRRVPSLPAPLDVLRPGRGPHPVERSLGPPLPGPSVGPYLPPHIPQSVRVPIRYPTPYSQVSELMRKDTPDTSLSLRLQHEGVGTVSG